MAFENLRTPDGDHYVIPSDAQSLIASGALDRELFNVAYLVKNGYGDGVGGSIPVIVEYPERLSVSVERQRAQDLPASNVTTMLESIDAASLNVSKANAETFWSRLTDEKGGARLESASLVGSATKVWLDRKVTVDLNESVPQVGAPHAWAAGYDGTGVTVAVLDTGIDETHPDVSEKVAASRTFIPDETTVVDGHGHGTHVAATIAGTGGAQGGTYKGVAPGAQLVIGKVLDDTGSGSTTSVIEGMEWAALEQGAGIVSMSLGCDPSPNCATDGTSPQDQAVNRLTEETGALFVIAAGNEGPEPRTVGSPGSADAALTVAAVDKTDQLARFSSRGPRLDGALKPDIAAPGVGIVAARAAGTDMDGGATPINDFYSRASGTSMATPHVAGAAAILAQQHPDWHSGELKSALTGSAHSAVEVNPYEMGAGRLDVAAAVEQVLTASPSSIDFGSVSAPHSKTVTLRNHATTPVTVSLTARVSDPNGEPADDAITLSSSTVPVPANGTAVVNVGFDPGHGPFGDYGGLVRALDPSGEEVLRLAVGANFLPPMHTVTLRVVPPAAFPSPRFNFGNTFWTLLRVDAPQDPITVQHNFSSHTNTVRVPEGVYWVSSSVWNDQIDPLSGDVSSFFLTEPEFVVKADNELVLDARRAKPVTVATPRASEDFSMGMTFARGTSFGGEWALHHTGGWRPGNVFGAIRLFVTPTRSVETGTFRSVTTFGMMEPPFTMRLLGKDPLTLHTRYADYTIGPRASLDRTVELVDIGTGSAEEIERARVRGRIALFGWDWQAQEEKDGQWSICLNDLRFDHPWQRLKDAGAIAAVAFLDVERDGRFGLCPTAPDRPDRGPKHLPLPVVTVGPVEGNVLRQRARRGPVQAAVRGSRDTSYMYWLRFDDPDGIPDPPDFKVREHELAAIDSHYHADAPVDLETSWTPIRDGIGELTVPHFSQAPVRRTEYLYPPSPDLFWWSDTRVQNALQDMDTLELVFARSGRRVEHWHGAPRVPGIKPVIQFQAGRQLCSACREENAFYPFMGLSTPAASHDGGAIGEIWVESDELHTSGEWHLYRNGVEVPCQLVPEGPEAAPEIVPLLPCGAQQEEPDE